MGRDRPISRRNDGHKRDASKDVEVSGKKTDHILLPLDHRSHMVKTGGI